MNDLIDDFEQQNEINRQRHRLDDIRQMINDIPELHITVSSYAMDLAGPAPSVEPPLPGGDALDITGPWSPNATYGDQAPPRQVITEWAMTVYDAHDQVPPPGLRFTQALTYLREKTPWILSSPWADTYRAEINAVYGRLRALCPPEVDESHDDTSQEESTDITAMWHLIPNGKMLTRDETEMFIPGKLDQRDWATLRKRTQRARETGHEIPASRYPIEWIRDTLSESACA